MLGQQPSRLTGTWLWWLWSINDELWCDFQVVIGEDARAEVLDPISVQNEEAVVRTLRSGDESDCLRLSD
jgi:hypothetical protein